MSEGVKKYIIISGTILMILLSLGLSWLFKFNWIFVFIFTYLSGIANGMLILGVTNYEE